MKSKPTKKVEGKDVVGLDYAIPVKPSKSGELKLKKEAREELGK